MQYQFGIVLLDIDFGINWSIEDCVAVGRGVGLLDWVDTSGVEVLAPPLSLAGPLVSHSSATASFTVGCTVRICLCRLCVEPALYEILFWQILHCALTLSTLLKCIQVLLTHFPAVVSTAVLPLSPRLLSVWLWVSWLGPPSRIFGSLVDTACLIDRNNSWGC